MDANSARRLYRFGVFEADEHTGELRKQGRRLPLQGQPVQVLLLLLDRPGELVSRAEIHQRVWSDGTFVDFDHGLNTAINKIREALGDSAASPRFVETLARRGYRFIAPVEVATAAAPVSATPGPDAASDASQPEPAPLTTSGATDSGALTARPAASRGRRLLAGPDDLPSASQPLVRVLFVLLQVMYLGFYAVSLARLRIVEDVVAGAWLHTRWAVVLLIVTAAVGIPTRLYLLTAAAFRAPGLRENFLKIFPVIFPLDELWALAPFLLAPWIGFGAALGATAALLYAPFAQRSLILMGAGAPAKVQVSAKD
jgi:DNA-binding winged helix-turn-helix (wHTH) protein